MKTSRIAGAMLAAFLAAVSASPAGGQTTDSDCSTLKQKYDRYVTTADTMVMDLTNKILQSGGTPDILGRLGLDLGNAPSPEEAVRKGAVAAISPPAQNAIMIYLLFANTTMQEMIWKGCKAS